MIKRRGFLVSKIKGILPLRIKNILKQAEYIRMFQGVSSRECNICSYHGRFKVAGTVPRIDSLCPSCGSYERQRLLALAIESTLDTVTGSALLFAPEKCIEKYLDKRNIEYVTADYAEPADLKLNIEKLDLKNDSHSVILCSHVLEHVDDKLAIKELYRVLSHGGILFAMVPLVDGWDTSYENAEVESEMDRFLHYGQNDHLRIYGADFIEKLERNGFVVERFVASGVNTVKHSLIRGESVFIAKKQ